MTGLITTGNEYQIMLERLKRAPVVAIDTETTGLGPYVADEIRGISVATNSNEWYLPISHPDSRNFDPKPLLHAIRSKKYVFHHGVFDWAFIAQIDSSECWWRNTVWDTQVGNWLIDENLKVGLKPSAERILMHDAGAEQRALKAIKGKTWATYSAEDIGAYAAMDARLTYDLWLWQNPHVSVDVMRREMEVQRGLFRMIRTGITVDPDIAAEGEGNMRDKMAELEDYFSEQGVLPTSPKQVGEWLYDRCGYECPIYTKKTRSRSTAVAALQSLAANGAHEAELLLRHRHLAKAVSAYFVPLRRTIGDDGRIHPHFSSTRTVTGRFSCSNPNLQTIPRDDTLPEVRRCFVPAPGKELWEYDLKQAELRVIAGYAQEPAMIDALENGRDLHSETAEAMFGPDFTPLQRRFAKNLNFGFAYYIGPEKFATYLSPVPSRCAYWRLLPKQRQGKRKLQCGVCDVCEAEKILDGYRETYPRLVKVRDAFAKRAEKTGVFPSISPGKYRHFRGAGYQVPYYTAFNFAVQGGIGEFMKDVMNEWYRGVDADHPDARYADLCLQIHDALVFEITPGMEDVQLARLQGIADRVNPFYMRMEWDKKEWK